MIIFFLLLFATLMNNFSSIQIQPTIKQFQVMENCPNGTIVGLIPTYSSNHRMILLDDAHGRFIINSKGEIIVSVFILFFFVNYNSKYYIIIWTELYIFLF
ncbi:unnamed protein product [Adineta steineri]|uniref:Uncharacterized protein n=1 Tax=Adineta steineri TaxID=433720 RepID=A0A814BTF5_9BILA|nr:unnamed protein product [Adineta steineri]